jgi:hypothetical protein
MSAHKPLSYPKLAAPPSMPPQYPTIGAPIMCEICQIIIQGGWMVNRPVTQEQSK